MRCSAGPGFGHLGDGDGHGSGYGDGEYESKKM